MTEQQDASATDLGYLTGGARAAVRTGLAMLHARGLVVADPPGRLRRAGVLPARLEPLERALFGALHGAMAPREVANQPQVRRALAEHREGLIGLGLLRPAWRRIALPAMLVLVPPLLVARLVADDVVGGGAALLIVLAFAVFANLFLPRQTVAGARLLRDARRRHPVPGAPATDPAAEPGTAVALYGVTALRILMPQFARDSGLLQEGWWTRLLDAFRPGVPSLPAGAV
ncbi:TIGR04222 domain-containing membrane protein [Plantactinospora sp. B24E8]|uniref:TIGR04222 domain-containing membrane protein n=1 Tax=Plantactinospora sp. B24E8 TaxID=3153567 RepID=UPI00325EDC90